MMKEKKWIAILAFHRTGCHAAVDLILTEQKDDQSRDDGDDDTGADVLYWLPMGPENTYSEVATT